MLEHAIHFPKVQTFRHFGCGIEQIFTSTFLPVLRLSILPVILATTRVFFYSQMLSCWHLIFYGDVDIDG